MKKILLIAIFAFNTFVYANVNAVVSILPQKTFLEAIGGDKVNVSLMVKPGNSPHSYEPKPSQMKDISKADIYFSIGVEFEKNWLPKFANQNKKMKIVNIAKGIKKIPMEEHSHEHEEHKDEHHEHDEHKDEHHDHDKHKDEHHEHDEHSKEDNHGTKDPHVWTSPSNVKLIAKNIYKYLVKIDKVNQSYYKTNLDKFLKQINQTDKEIKQILSNTPKEARFMVFHPAWGYFAKEYNLTQIAIESGGKNPKPKYIMHLIDEAKEENVKAIFTAPEFSDKVASQIAKEVGVPVIKVSPLNPNWSKNLINLAKAIANK